MLVSRKIKGILLLAATAASFLAGTAAFAVSGAAGIGSVATTVASNLGAIAKLITAGSYVAGFGFAVAAIVKFKAHKDTPTQVHISQPIVLLFVGAALIFVPSVFGTTGATLFGTSKTANTVSGISSF